MIFLKCESIVIVSNNVVLNGIVQSSSRSYFGSESLCIQRRPQIVLIVNEEGLPVKGNRKKNTRSYSMVFQTNRTTSNIKTSHTGQNNPVPESLFFALLFSQFLRGVEIDLSSLRASTSVTLPAIKFEALSNDSPREMRKWFSSADSQLPCRSLASWLC